MYVSCAMSRAIACAMMRLHTSIMPRDQLHLVETSPVMRQAQLDALHVKLPRDVNVTDEHVSERTKHGNCP